MVGSSCGWVGREEVKRDWSVFFFFFSALASAKKTKIGSVSFTSSVRERTDDMDPLSWHNRLLSCWQDQQIKNCSNPSLFRAICYAYGWPYVRLGLLKVLNDCIGFAGPLAWLLNKLFRFLQQGSGHLDGYVLAMSLGLTEAYWEK